MAKTETTADGPVAVPLIELLRSIPRDARLVVEDDWKSSRVWPIGILSNDAANEIGRLRSAIRHINLQAQMSPEYAPIAAIVKEALS